MRATDEWLVFPHELQGLTREEILAHKPVDGAFFDVEQRLCTKSEHRAYRLVRIRLPNCAANARPARNRCALLRASTPRAKIRPQRLKSARKRSVLRTHARSDRRSDPRVTRQLMRTRHPRAEDCAQNLHPLRFNGDSLPHFKDQ